jgi:16S rRNA (guanine966-N2)-methyltransferase
MVATMAVKKRGPQQVRIIGGKWKGRKLQFSGDASLRPTLGRTRETLFNWLRPSLAGARCLDAFAGSGVLGFEALSQGADSVVLIEQNSRSVQSLKLTIDTLQAAQDAHVQRGDAVTYLASADTPFDIVFLDPPFDRVDLLHTTMRLLSERKLLTGYAYAEARSLDDLQYAAQHSDMHIVKTTRAGDTVAVLMQPHAVCS